MVVPNWLRLHWPLMPAFVERIESLSEMCAVLFAVPSLTNWGIRACSWWWTRWPNVNASESKQYGFQHQRNAQYFRSSFKRKMMHSFILFFYKQRLDSGIITVRMYTSFFYTSIDAEEKVLFSSDPGRTWKFVVSLKGSLALAGACGDEGYCYYC